MKPCDNILGIVANVPQTGEGTEPDVAVQSGTADGSSPAHGLMAIYRSLIETEQDRTNTNSSPGESLCA